MKLYIAVLDEFPDFMVPTLIAHTVLSAHIQWTYDLDDELLRSYEDWLYDSFKKVVVKVNQKEFDKIAAIPYTFLGHENKTLCAKKSCAILLPLQDDAPLPNVLKFAKLWTPTSVVQST